MTDITHYADGITWCFISFYTTTGSYIESCFLGLTIEYKKTNDRVSPFSQQRSKCKNYKGHIRVLNFEFLISWVKLC